MPRNTYDDKAALVHVMDWAGRQQVIRLPEQMLD